MKKIDKDEYVVTAYAAPASGPGWANAPVWVIVRGRDGALREECIQPDDQSRAMRTLYRIAAEVNAIITADARQILQKSR